MLDATSFNGGLSFVDAGFDLYDERRVSVGMKLNGCILGAIDGRFLTA